MTAIIQTHESTQQVQTARDRHRTEFAIRRYDVTLHRRALTPTVFFDRTNHAKQVGQGAYDIKVTFENNLTT